MKQLKHGHFIESTKHLVVLLVTFTLSACSGLKFTNRADLNLPLSPELLGTSVFTDTEILKRHLEEIPGYIVIADGAGKLTAVAPIAQNGSTPTVTPIKEDQPFYHSVIDKSAGVQGSYLSVVSAELTDKQTAEITVSETSESFIPRDHVPWDAIVHWVKSHPKTGAENRYYVQAALLANISKTIYVETDANATVDGGAAFGAKGKIYATNKSTQTSNTAYIGTHLLDVDAIAANPPGPGSKGDYQIKVGLTLTTIEGLP